MCSELALLALVFRGVVLLPYLAGAAVLAIGLAAVSWSEVREAPGLEKLVPLGPMLFAVPMAVFSGDHFAFSRSVATIVPRWMPWHMFWTYFVGTALIAAALSIAAKKESQLAATMLSIMLFLFVLMIHIPNCFAAPYERQRYTLVLRELGLSSGALAFAAAQAEDWRRGVYRGLGLALASAVWKKIPPLARVVIGIMLIDFGIQQLLFPTFAPGIPQDGRGVVISMPSWIPAHALWGYLSGVIFIACGVALLLNRKPRVAATLLAATVLVWAASVYLPLTIKNVANIDVGLNYLAIHFALAGEMLLLATALPKRAAEEVLVPAAEGTSLRRAGG
jgi:uncharacterized membrane protein